MVQDDKLISVVIPAYNAEGFIADAVGSVFDQLHRPLELLVVNDGSKDATLDIANSFVAREPDGKELIVVDLKENKGAANALNVGFSKANGDYICWLSADDMFTDKRKITTQLRHMINSGALVSYFKDYYIGPNPLEANLMEPSYIKIKGTRALDSVFNAYSSLRAMMLVFLNPINGSSIMIDRQCLKRWGQFDPVLKNVDADGDLWMRYSFLGLRFYAIDGSPLFYRQHPNQTSQNTIKMIYGIDLTRMRILSYLAESGRLEGILRKFSPFLLLASSRKYHLHCPISSQFLSEFILSKTRWFDPLTTKYARSILKDANGFLEGTLALDTQQFYSDLHKISDSQEFKRFQDLMERSAGQQR